MSEWTEETGERMAYWAECLAESSEAVHLLDDSGVGAMPLDVLAASVRRCAHAGRYALDIRAALAELDRRGEEIERLKALPLFMEAERLRVRAEAAEANMKLMEQARDMRDTEFELQRQELMDAEAKLAEARCDGCGDLCQHALDAKVEKLKAMLAEALDVLAKTDDRVRFHAGGEAMARLKLGDMTKEQDRLTAKLAAARERVRELTEAVTRIAEDDMTRAEPNPYYIQRDGAPLPDDAPRFTYTRDTPRSIARAALLAEASARRAGAENGGRE